MSDIVDRLRKAANLTRDSISRNLMHEAATEIESQRGARLLDFDRHQVEKRHADEAAHRISDDEMVGGCGDG